MLESPTLFATCIIPIEVRKASATQHLSPLHHDHSFRTWPLHLARYAVLRMRTWKWTAFIADKLLPRTRVTQHEHEPRTRLEMSIGEPRLERLQSTQSPIEWHLHRYRHHTSSHTAHAETSIATETCVCARTRTRTPAAEVALADASAAADALGSTAWRLPVGKSLPPISPLPVSFPPARDPAPPPPTPAPAPAPAPPPPLLSPPPTLGSTFPHAPGTTPGRQLYSSRKYASPTAGGS
jgi:hypothetical protein